jgi:hypothetical protein
VAKSDVTLVKRDGFHFYNVTAIHVKFGIGGLKLHMGNLFDGIKALGKFGQPLDPLTTNEKRFRGFD